MNSIYQNGSFAWPVKSIPLPLVMFTRRREVMGALVNSRVVTFAAAAVATVITCLNVTLIALTLS